MPFCRVCHALAHFISLKDLTYLRRWALLPQPFEPMFFSLMSGWFLILLCFKDISVLSVNREGPDQTPRSVCAL